MPCYTYPARLVDHDKDSPDTSYASYENEDSGQYGSYSTPTPIMRCALNTFWVIMLTSYSGFGYALGEFEYSGRYSPYAKPFRIMPCHSYPIRLVGRNFGNVHNSANHWCHFNTRWTNSRVFDLYLILFALVIRLIYNVICVNAMLHLSCMFRGSW